MSGYEYWMTATVGDSTEHSSPTRSYQPWVTTDDIEEHSDGTRYVRMEFDLDNPITAADLNWEVEVSEGEVSVEDNVEPRCHCARHVRVDDEVIAVVAPQVELIVSDEEVEDSDIEIVDFCRVDELGHVIPPPPARTWIGALNHRIAQDEVLASLRREAFFHAEQAENRLAEWADEQEDSVTERIKRGEKIAERPVHFSWLDGPA